MPPAFEDPSDASDDVDELPPQKPPPKKKAAARTKVQPDEQDEDEPLLQVANGNGADDHDNDDQEDDEDEEEYVVEAVLSHEFESDGTCKYEVKWLGYDSDADRTWEPEENLSGAPEVLQAYFKKCGGRPQFKQKTPAARGRGKRKSAPASTDPVATPAKRGRRSKSGAAQPAESPEFKLPEGSWEDHVQAVESIEEVKKGDGGLHVYLQWNDGHKSYHPTTVIRRKCPQKLITFYESKLVFRTPDEETGAA